MRHFLNSSAYMCFLFRGLPPISEVGRDYYGDDMAGLKLSQPLGEHTIYDGLYVPPRPLGEDTDTE